MCGILFCARWDSREEGEDSRLDRLLEELKVANARRGLYSILLGLRAIHTVRPYLHDETKADICNDA